MYQICLPLFPFSPFPLFPLSPHSYRLKAGPIYIYIYIYIYMLIRPGLTVSWDAFSAGVKLPIPSRALIVMKWALVSTVLGTGSKLLQKLMRAQQTLTTPQMQEGVRPIRSRVSYQVLCCDRDGFQTQPVGLGSGVEVRA